MSDQGSERKRQKVLKCSCGHSFANKDLRYACRGCGSKNRCNACYMQCALCFQCTQGELPARSQEDVQDLVDPTDAVQTSEEMWLQDFARDGSDSRRLINSLVLPQQQVPIVEDISAMPT